MKTMKAYQLTAWGRPPEFVEVPVPEPGAGEVLVRVAAVGLCGSDLHAMSAPAGTLPFTLPFTLGHENAGIVAALGAGATHFQPGDSVLASSVNCCGYCPQCLAGRDNFCWLSTTMRTRGLGEHGGLAEYLVVPERSLIKLGDLRPEQAAPLADAGGTAYHAVQQIMPVLPPGSSVLVIGAGGLGAFAAQYLKQLTATNIHVVDQNPRRLEYVKSLGADQSALVSEFASTTRVNAVLDFVGTDETLGLASRAVLPLGKIVVIGMGGGQLPFSWGAMAPGVEASLSIGFSLSQLREVVALAERGRLQIDIEPFAFADTPLAYEELAAGQLRGRAVVMMDGKAAP